MPKRLTTEEFIEKAKAKHGDKYDYSDSVYVRAHDKIGIICRKHGPFQQAANDHLKGSGCRACQSDYISESLKKTTSQFITSAREVHGDTYSYGKVNYTGCRSHVVINCPIHGEFKQRPIEHLKGCGCQKCCWKHNGKTVVYLVKMVSSSEEMLKIGITNYTTEDRFNKTIYDGFEITEIATLEFRDRQDARTIEAYLHTKHRKHKFTPKVKFGGHTECFNIEALETIKQDFGV